MFVRVSPASEMSVDRGVSPDADTIKMIGEKSRVALKCILFPGAWLRTLLKAWKDAVTSTILVISNGLSLFPFVLGQSWANIGNSYKCE